MRLEFGGGGGRGGENEGNTWAGFAKKAGEEWTDEQRKGRTKSSLSQFENKLGYRRWREVIYESPAGRVDVFCLRRDDIFLIEGVVGVNVGMGKHRGASRLDFGGMEDELCFSRFADRRIHYGQDEIFVVERSGTVQRPKCCGLAVAIVVNAGRVEYGAHGFATLMGGVHGEYVAHRRDAALVFVAQIQTVQAVDQLRAVAHGDFFRMAVEDIERHAAEHRVAQGGHLLELIAGSGLAAGLVPGTPFVDDQLDRVTGVLFGQGLPVIADH